MSGSKARTKYKKKQRGFHGTRQNIEEPVFDAVNSPDKMNRSMEKISRNVII